MTTTVASEPTRLGFLVPERNVACETEFPRFAPAGVTCHFNRLPRDGARLTAESLVAMMEAVDGQSRLLSDIGARVIMCACTSGSFLGGAAKADDLGGRVAAATGIPAFSTSQAVVDALRALGAHRVFMLTPYPEDITLAEVAFFEAFGFAIPRWTSFFCKRSEDIRRITPAEVVERVLAEADAVAAADAVFLSCTALHTMTAIADLEARTGRPVVSSNSATLWRALRAAGLPPSDIGGGRLFECDLVAPEAALSR